MSKTLMLFAGNSHLGMAREIAQELNSTLHEPGDPDERGWMSQWFSNGECLLKIGVDVRGAHCFVVQTHAEGNQPMVGKENDGADLFDETRRLSVSDHLIELLLIVDALRSAGAHRITAVMPYFSYIRTDKPDHPRMSIAARLMAMLLEAAGVTGVLLLDPHFPQFPGFFRCCKVDTLSAKALFTAHILRNHDTRNAVVVAPDIGEARHTGPIAGMLGLPIAIIDKRRKKDDEQAEAEHLIGDVEGKDCWVFDDETATCGTLLEAARFCREKGAHSMHCCITHPVLSKPEGLQKLQADPLIQELIVLDTTPVPPEKRVPKLTVLPIGAFLAGAIKTIAHVESLEHYKGGFYREVEELKSSA